MMRKTALKERIARQVQELLSQSGISFGRSFNAKWERPKPPPRKLITALSQIPRPIGSKFTADEWTTIMLTLRYSGARLHEVCGMRGEDVYRAHGIPIFRVKAGVIPFRPGGGLGSPWREIPVHPALEDRLFARAKRIGSGLMFPHAGCDGTGGRYGFYFARLYTRSARKIWPKMNVFSWRIYVAHYLTDVTRVANAVVERLVYNRYIRKRDRKSALIKLYRVVKNLP